MTQNQITLTVKHDIFNGGIAGLSKRALELYESFLAVGFPKAVQYDNGATVPEVAYWNEYGTSRGIPARPFLRPAIYNNVKTIREMMKKSLAAFLEKKINMAQTWGLIGQVCVKNIREQIDNTRTPPNAFSTTIKKTSKSKPKKNVYGPLYSHPLIDTAKMKQSVSYIIVKR
jgi:hypothetical protein